MKRISTKEEWYSFIKENISIIQKVLYNNETNKTIWDILWQINFIVNWNKLCRLNDVLKKNFCNEIWLNIILDEYLEETTTEEKEIIWFIKDYLKVKKEIKNEKSRLYNYIIKWQEIDDYKSNEFSIFTILEAIKQIWDIKLVSKDMYDLIILSNNKLYIKLFLDFLYTLNIDNYLHIQDNTLVLQRLENHLGKEKIQKLKKFFENQKNI